MFSLIALPRHLTYKLHTTDNPLTDSDEGLEFKTTVFPAIFLRWRIDVIKTVDKNEFFCFMCTREWNSYFFYYKIRSLLDLIIKHILHIGSLANVRRIL